MHSNYSQSPSSLELSGKNEMLIWCLTFLTSTWYIKNPFLKAKIVEVLPAIPPFIVCANWGARFCSIALGIGENIAPFSRRCSTLTQWLSNT